MRGATFDATITLYTDAAQTHPYDLTGLTVELVIDGVATLTAGSGLTVTPASGLVVAQLSVSQTAGMPLGSVAYQLKLTASGGRVDFPLGGQIDVIDP